MLVLVEGVWSCVEVEAGVAALLEVEGATRVEGESLIAMLLCGGLAVGRFYVVEQFLNFLFRVVDAAEMEAHKDLSFVRLEEFLATQME